MCQSVGKADLLSAHFLSKLSRESVNLQLTGYPSPSLTTFAFRPSEFRCLLSYLDPYGAALAHWVCFLFFSTVTKQPLALPYSEC